MKNGIYKIYSVQEDERGAESHRYLGRLAVVQGSTQVLEDHGDGIVSQMFPDGVVDAQKAQRLAQIQESPYFQVQEEGLIDNENQRPMPMPAPRPSEVFSVIDQHGQKQKLEAYGEDIFLDGKHLDPKALEQLQTQIRNKELHIRPEQV